MLDGYTDSNMEGDVDYRKSISRSLMTFAGGGVSWQSKLQKCVALSTLEAKYIAIIEGCKEAFVTPLTRHPKWMSSGDATLRDRDSYSLTFSFSELTPAFICTIYVITKIISFTYTLYIPP